MATNLTVTSFAAFAFIRAMVKLSHLIVPLTKVDQVKMSAPADSLLRASAGAKSCPRRGVIATSLPVKSYSGLCVMPDGASPAGETFSRRRNGTDAARASSRTNNGQCAPCGKALA